MSDSDSDKSKKGPLNYEIDRMPMAAVFGGAAGLFVLLAVVFGVVWILVQKWTDEPWPQPAPPAPPSATARWNDLPPQLQIAPGTDLVHLRQVEHARLHAVRWTDDSHTYATIPIEETMKLMGEAAAKGQLATLLPPPQPATPLDLQNQKSGAVAAPASPAPAQAAAPPAPMPAPVPQP
jgi:hypothetical protein